MNQKKSVLDNVVVRTVILFAVLFAIGLITRLPAWQFPQFYALHGVLAAPFFSALALWHFNRQGSIIQLFIGVLAMAAVLGAMSAVMGLSFLLLAVCTLAAYGVLGLVAPERRNFACAVLFGALDYPCALVVGILLGSYAFSYDALLVMVILLIVSIALSLFAALLMEKVKR